MLKNKDFNKSIHLIWVFIFYCLIGTQKVSSQYFNKEVAAFIEIEQAGDIVKLYAIAENKTSVLNGLKYDFAIYKTDLNNEIQKQNSVKDFVIKPYERKVLSNYTLTDFGQDKVTVVILIYEDGDKPIGKDRVELLRNDKGIVEVLSKENRDRTRSIDLAAADKGLKTQGFVLKKTLTRVGQDFYRLFFSEYFLSQIKTGRTIKILEEPGQSRLTRISVSVDGRLVWQFFAQPKKQFLKEMASVAFQRCVRQIQILDRQQEQLIGY